MTQHPKRDRRKFYARLKKAYELSARRPLASKAEATAWFASVTGIGRGTADDWVKGRVAPKPWAWLLLEQMEYLNKLRLTGGNSEALLWRLQSVRTRVHGDVGSFLNALKEAEDSLVREVGYSPVVETAKEFAREQQKGVTEASTGP